MAFVALGGTNTAQPTSGFTPIDFSASAPVAPAPVQQPSLASNIWSGIKSVASDVFGAAKDAFTSAPAQDALSAPTNAPNDTVKSLFTNLTQAGHQMVDGASAVFDSHQSALGKGLGVAQAGLGAVNAAFAPVNAIITYAQHVPVLGTLASGLNALFGAIGTGGADTAEGAVDALPISDTAKAQIMPVAKQAGALVGQILAGKVAGDAFHTLADHTKNIIDTLNSGIDAAKLTVDHGTFHPLPVEDANVKPTEAVPRETPSATVPPTVPESDGGATAAPTTTPAPEVPAKPVLSPLQPKTAPLEDAKPLPTEPGVSKVGKSIEQKAIDAGLTQRFDKTAGYDPKTVADQIKRTTDLVVNNHEEARAIVRGDKPVPEGMSPAMLIDAMEQHLGQKPDPQLAYELANSPLTSGTSVHAQEMRLIQERNPDSITAKFNEVRAARKVTLEKRGGTEKAVKKETNAIRKHVKKAASPRITWEDFIKNEITCRV